MFAQLGNIIFQNKLGFVSLESSDAATYSEIEIFGRKPKIQKTGDALRKLEVGLYFHKNFTDPAASIERLNIEMRQGNVLPLVMGDGDFVGNFVISSIRKTTSTTASDGSIISAFAALNLIEDADASKPAERASNAAAEGFAINVERVVPVREVEQPKSDALLAAEDAATVNKSVNQIGLVTEKATNNPSLKDEILGPLENVARQTSIAALSVRQNINKVQAEIDDAQGIINDAADVSKFALDMASAAASGNLEASQIASNNLALSNANMQSQMSQVNALIALKKF